jgi:ABC-type Na+ transport system ATPase subunit NatA
LISDIQAFCDEVVIINKGELVVQDSVENLVKAHSKNLEEIYLELKGRGK